jgi:DNA-binding HxlR family transcriptional regulator
MEYGQFCPIAKALEILGERWTLLIVRELLMGATRFNEMQRGLNQISPSILTSRLNDLANAGIVIRKKIPGQRGYEYFLTEMGKDLYPVVSNLGEWGMRWARGKMDDSDIDLELLMLYLQRSVLADKLPGNETVIRFKFTDVDKFSDWWLVATDNNVDVCIRDPGKDVDIYFTTGLRTMIEVWMGDIPYRSAIKDGSMKVVGPSALTRDLTSWLSLSVFAGIPPATAIQ